MCICVLKLSFEQNFSNKLFEQIHEQWNIFCVADKWSPDPQKWIETLCVCQASSWQSHFVKKHYAPACTNFERVICAHHTLLSILKGSSLCFNSFEWPLEWEFWSDEVCRGPKNFFLKCPSGSLLGAHVEAPPSCKESRGGGEGAISFTCRNL